ncbi:MULTISPECIES: hypothetical protein [unclassified Leptolyngbya]|uniref:hypothetical protein n=1 Tax=unclassified Leptolyngbya TaxID=2650499 RepID=UPI001685CE21|nr:MULTISPECIES: hypothetical protein [unclassified Leptolyngbya]MBD1910207.1 hypothetical protein [Leptolyngbya sp. FACHB-8]MBD2153405.1 hypothetical protein [Leptolyngbya sp. FACHB-16]
MSSISPKVSACRHCLYYQVEGRRGGNCHQLGVPVQAQWKACPLATPCFAESSVKTDEDLLYQPALTPVMEVIPTVAVMEVPTAADVIPIAGAVRRLVRPPSLMA